MPQGEKYIELFRRYLSWHYFEEGIGGEGRGEDYLIVVAKQLDDVIRNAKNGVTARFWQYAEDAALPFLLQNYALSRIEAFTPQQTRQQVADAWTTWDFAGSEEGILRETRRLGYPNVALLPVWSYRHTNDGFTDKLEFRETIAGLRDHNPGFHPRVASATRVLATDGAFGDGWWVDYNFHYSSFFLVIQAPHPFGFRRWGDGWRWGSGPWDALVTGDRIALRQLYETVKKFTPAEWSCRGVLFAYNGRTRLAEPALWATWTRSGYDAWVVGSNGYAAHWDGANWTKTPTGTTQHLFGVTGGVGSLEAWAVGANGTVLRWDGDSWHLDVPVTLQTLAGVTLSGTTLWACGTSGTLLRRDLGGWGTVASGTAQNLREFWGAGENDLWCVGGGGTAIWWNGLVWSVPAATGTANDLYGVWGSSSSSVWAVGNAGTILHWNGTAWAAAVSPTTKALRAIYGVLYKDGGGVLRERIVAVGDDGIVLTYDAGAGATWAIGAESLPSEAWGLSGTYAENLWACTDQGDVIAMNASGRVYYTGSWNRFNWNDGTRYALRYVLKTLAEKWER